ncbi:hypothetical protein F4803DRAFT_573640 [Xylaria telfairii]|nr:hypothetical protein F4803DRAFT_573640 [Xylaria telfairii]
MGSLKNGWNSLKLKLKYRGRSSGIAAPPASPGAPLTDGTKPRTSTSHTASANNEPSTPIVPSTDNTISNVTSHLAVEANSGAEEGQLAINTGDQQLPKEPISQRLWNAAYDGLEQDGNTAELVRSYINILTKTLRAEKASGPPPSEDSISIELKKPANRQEYMKKLVEGGLEKFASMSKITSRLSNAVEYIEKVKGLVNLAIENIIPQAALPWAGVCIGLQILSNPGRATKSNLKGIIHVISRMDWYCALSERLLDESELVQSFKPVLKELEKAIITLYKALILYQIKSACYYHQNRGITIFRGFANLDDWDGDLEEVENAEADFMKMLAQYHMEDEKTRLRGLLASCEAMENSLGDIHQDMQGIINQQKSIWIDNKHKACLKDLFVVDPRDNMKTIMDNKEELLADVSKWIFGTTEYSTFMNWRDEASDTPMCRLLWVSGPAGTGKTMLLMGIVRKLESQFSSLSPRLSYFFCQGTNKTLNNATAILRSLIWLLLFQQPKLIEHILPDHDLKGRALFENQDAFHALGSIFEDMLKDPSLSPVYFIVDALDECDQQGLAPLLRLISKSLTLSDKVKWVISSRPDVNIRMDIQHELREFDSSKAIVKIDSGILEQPVNIYIDYKLSDLRRLPGYNNKNVLDDISTEVRQRANNTFLWVALALKELSKVPAYKAAVTIKSMPRGLSELYDRMMDKIKNLQECKDVLIAVSLALRPLSLPELAVVAGLPAGDDVPRTVAEECGSFLTITGEEVFLIHQSAKDYLSKVYESKLQSSGAAQGHAGICERSIDAMSANLRENIYSVPDFDFNPDDIIQPPDQDPLASIRYACLFWVDHLSFIPHHVDHYDRVHSFLKIHFLHWLEALSLMGEPSQCGRIISKLEILSSGQNELHSLVYDAKRFILKNASIIESVPIQLYSSAILFSPQASKIRNLFIHNIDGINILSGLDRNWGPSLQTFKGSFVTATFLPDGERLVLNSLWNSIIEIRNIVTSQVEHRLKGHSGFIYPVALSPEGSLLAAGSSDTTIRIWNTTTRKTERILEGHESTVLTVAFSPCGQLLASSSYEYVGTLWLWDVATGETKRVLKIPSPVNITLFSPGGEKLVIGCKDGTIWMWDVRSGQNDHTLEGCDRRDKPCVALSLDWSKLASLADKKTIQLWDVATWQLKHLLKGHLQLVDTVIFSPRNKVLSGSEDGTVRVWNVVTGHTEHILEINSPHFGIVLSPNGNHLASFSIGGIVQLWDTATWDTKCTLGSHSTEVLRATFSPNNQRLVSSSRDSVIVWDIATGLIDQAFEGHSDGLQVLAFSPDGTKLASASRDTTIRIWNMTGRAEKILRHSNQVDAAVFSPSGSKLASASGETGTVCIWDVITGEIKNTIDHQGGRVRAIVFSCDEGKVAFMLWDDHYIRLWDTATGKMMFFPCYRGRFKIMEFSPDGRKIASISPENAVCFWNTISGQREGTLEGHSSQITTLTFSKDGKKLASASYDGTIMVWEVATGRVECTLSHMSPQFRGFEVLALLFSLDGSKIAISEVRGNDDDGDDAIQVWDIATGRAGHAFYGRPDFIQGTKFELNSNMTERSHSFYSVDRQCRWVVRDGTKFLYLPREFREHCVAIRGRAVAIGNKEGRVMIMEFADDIAQVSR